MLWIRFSRKLWGTIRKFPKKAIFVMDVRHMDLFVTIFGGHKMFKKKMLADCYENICFCEIIANIFLKVKDNADFFRKRDVFGDLHKCLFENGNVWRIFATRKFRKISPNYKHFAKMETGIFVSTLPWMFIQSPPWKWGDKAWKGTFVQGTAAQQQ
jgi:hypothetical protein